jgi:4-hydroxy-tetrahydrodipicolinate synthase
MLWFLTRRIRMARFGKFVPQGVIPAALLPFHEDFTIDEVSFKSHLADVASVKGISAITVNGHSTEVSSCNFDEQKRVLGLALEAVGGHIPLVNGIYADGSLEAARLARMAHAAGASCLLVFPPNVYRLGQRPEMAVEHFRRIADVTDLPVILFQYAVTAGGQCYPLKTIMSIADAVPSLMAIKDGCSSPELHECQVRTLQSLARPINVLTTHSAWLFSSLISGCNGLLSGSGSVIAELQARLFEAVRNHDLNAARRINERVHPTAAVFYASPKVDMHNRMKEALVLLGKLPRAVVRPPLMKLPDAEIEKVKAALISAGLLAAERGMSRVA